MHRSKLALVAALALVASTPARANVNELKLEVERIDQALARPATTQTAALKARRERLLAQLAGQQTPAAAAPTQVGASAPNFVVAPSGIFPGLCGALDYGVAGTTASFTSTPSLQIVDNATSTDTIVVSGLGSQIFDVDVTVAITHTWNADLTIQVVAPNGTPVTLSGNRGGSNDDVFNGTLFDDQSANPIGSYVFTNLVAAPDLQPDQGLNSTLRGLNPNGAWELRVSDNAAGDDGLVNSWSLSITDGTALTIAPSLSPSTTFSSGPTNIAIVDNSTVSSTVAVSGGPGSIAGMSVYVEVTHTWCADMLIQVQSPTGTIIDLSARRGGSRDNVFNGTTFSMTSPNPIASYAFVNNVVATSLRPDGNLDLLNGEDANGTWTLLINDNASGDVGEIRRFDVGFAAGCAQEYGKYCTAGTSLAGCVPTLSASGTRSATAASGFVVSASNLDGGRFAQIYYGVAPTSLPFGNGTLCVAPPLQRMGQAFFSNGTSGACDGTVSVDLQAFAATHPNAVAIPLTAGSTLFFQASVRDNGNTGNRVMSDALAVTLTP